jgi:hypothetical protein
MERVFGMFALGRSWSELEHPDMDAAIFEAMFF